MRPKASTVCSDRRLRALAAALLGILAAAPAHAQLRIDGADGLWIQLTGDSAAVHWLTASPTEGVLRVADGSATPLVVRTPAGLAHRAAFAIAGRDTVELSVGADAAERPDFTLRLGLRPPPRPPVTFAMPDTLFVFGDTHGEYDQLTAGMKAAGIIDDQLRWSAGRSHVVFAGDMTDRGPDVLRLLWFLHGLEPQAAAAGGRVHVLLGNHEVMVMLGDLRYVHEKELLVAQQHGVAYDQLFNRSTSVLGRWLASRPAVIRVGEVLVAHGGVAPAIAHISIEQFNDTLAHYLQAVRSLSDTTAIASADSATAVAHDDFFWGDRSVFWHRDYVRADSVGAELDETLRLWSAQTLVIGHTAVPRIAALYDGRVIAAHTSRYGAELLMLVRRGGQLERYRVTTKAPPERF